MQKVCSFIVCIIKIALEKSQMIGYLCISNGAEKFMIGYYKLDALLKERKITKTQLTKDTGISTNIVSKISKNEGFKTETIDRLCEYLQVQPSEIMEWIPNEEYEKQKQNAQNEEKAKIEQQIQELQAKLKTM